MAFSIALIVAGFAILAVAVRYWRADKTRPKIRRYSGWIALTIFGCSVGSGVLLWRYVEVARSEGERAREKAFDDFAAAPKIARLMNTVFRTPIYNNDDAIDLDGTTTLRVTLSPSDKIFTQFHVWRSKLPQRQVDKLWLKMRVSAPGFEVSPVLDETQSVPKDLMTFAWILRGRQSGDQLVEVSGVAFRQTPAGQIYNRATAVNFMRSIWVKPAFPIEAWTTIITTLITVLLGSGAIPFLIQWFNRSGSGADEEAAHANR